MSSEEASDLTPSVSYSFDSFTMVYRGTSATTQRRLVVCVCTWKPLCVMGERERNAHKNEELKQGENWARVRYM